MMVSLRSQLRLAMMAMACALGLCILALTRVPVLPNATIEPGSAAFEGPPAVDFTDVNSTLSYGAVLEKPLFHWSRRPLPSRPSTEAIPTPQPVEDPPPAVIMRGAIMSGTARKVIIEKAGHSDYLRLSEGDMLDGWTVVSIEAESAVLERDKRQSRLMLDPPSE